MRLIDICIFVQNMLAGIASKIFLWDLLTSQFCFYAPAEYTPFVTFADKCVDTQDQKEYI
jgi:hypothetical protein